MTFKDLFSQHATDYAQFRPHYPPDLFAWLASIAPGRELAVDVGAGNGQAAVALAQHFDRVIAVDPSAKQIANAPASPTDQVLYQQGTAEYLGCDSGTADLLVAAQACELRGGLPGRPALQSIVAQIRGISPGLEDDRPLDGDIEAIYQSVAAGPLGQRVEARG